MIFEFVDLEEFIHLKSLTAHSAFRLSIVKAALFSKSLSSAIVTSLDSFAKIVNSSTRLLTIGGELSILYFDGIIVNLASSKCCLIGD